MAPAGVSLNSVYSYLTAYDAVPTGSVSSYRPIQRVDFVGGQPIQINIDGDDAKPLESRYEDVQQIVIETPSPEAPENAASKANSTTKWSVGMKDILPPETPEVGLWQVRKELQAIQILMILWILLFLIKC